ncbi:DUF4219 domain-containing protein, partial [Escherichia coli]|uniref:DUF4219 domain-containing protein n=1 Tax=Escherichia coli TaxID=562 RepID=UPI0025787B78
MSIGVGKDLSTGITYPILTRTNFSSWSIKMQAVMEASELWDVVSPSDPTRTVNAKKNKMARATIFNAIPEDVLFMVATKESASEVWQALNTMFLGTNRVKSARIQTLKEEFDSMKMKGS